MQEKLLELDSQLEDYQDTVQGRKSGAYIQSLTEAKANIVALLRSEAELLKIAQSMRREMEGYQEIIHDLRKDNSKLLDAVIAKHNPYSTNL